MPDFDLVVIGSGPGGYVAAIRAAQLGLKTALVEKDKTLGGTCLNIGCIPSKALLNSSHHFLFAKHESASHGVVVGDVKLDLPTMLKRKDATVKQLTGGVAFLMKKNGVTVYQGTGKIAAAGQVTVARNDGATEELKTKNILLATGSVPIALPSMPVDGVTIVTSTEALAFDKVPERLVVIGAGAIGLELGSVWARLGAKVDVVEFLPRIAIGFDLEMAVGLQKALEKEGLKFHLETKVSGVEAKDGKATVRATGKDGKELVLEADKVLVAVGRRPFLGDVLPESLGVALDERKRVKVDAHFRTNVEGIYAIGDVIAGPMLAHKAEEEGVACAEFLAGKPGHVNYGVIPGVVYTHPELAGVGLTEDGREGAGRRSAGRQVPVCRERPRARQRQHGRLGENRGRRQDGQAARRTHPVRGGQRADRRNRRGDGIRRQRRGRRPHGPRAPDAQRSREGSRARRGPPRDSRGKSVRRAVARRPGEPRFSGRSMDDDLSPVPASHFDLAATLNSGQVFHWHPVGEGWAGVIGETPVYVEQRGEELRVTAGCTEIVAHYFALDHPLDAICASFPNDDAMTSARAACRGLRVIRQPLWECLATFITSSMKQVAHIRAMSLYLRARFGLPVGRIGGLDLHGYPAPQRLAALTADDLRAGGLGWRAETLLATARLVASGQVNLEAIRALDDTAALAALRALPGVGPKVANCVLLFAYERLAAFPIDVWIERVLRETYFQRKRRVTATRLREFSATYFGPFGGYAQQYLFHHARKGKKKKSGQGPGKNATGGG